MFGLRRLEARLVQFAEAGQLDMPDSELAAQQFCELCKAGIFHRAIFCGAATATPEEIERSVNSAVKVFLAAYGAKG